MAQSLKRTIQNLLKRLGLYYRLKSSRLHTLYWTVANPSLLESARRELDFYRHVLEGFHAGDLIFDIGANQGYKASLFLRLGARVLAVDPDEENKQVLEATFLKYRLTPKPIVIVNQAVSDKQSVETMWINEPGSAKNTLSRKWVDTLQADEQRFGHTLSFPQRKEITTTTLEQLFTDHGVPFFIKIDVEGYELNVLRGMRRPVPYLSFEVNLPEFRAEGLQCVELLGRMAPEGKFNYTSDCGQGLGLEESLGPEDFSLTLTNCASSSIEVFWKTPRINAGSSMVSS